MPRNFAAFSQEPRNSSQYKATATVIVDRNLLDPSAEDVSLQNTLSATGRATVLRASDGIKETFGAGDSIIVEVGDTITAWEGKTVITFFDGHTTVLTPVSKIKIVSMSEDEGIETISLYQYLGSSANHVENPSQGKTEFDIKTDSSVASVRGTDFNVQICGPEQTFYQTFQGVVEVNKEGESAIVDAGFQLLAETDRQMEVRPLPNVPICNDSRAVLEYPLNGEYVFTSTISVFGTVIHDNFDYWKLEYKPKAELSDNYSFLYSSREPISNGFLTNIDVSHLSNGDYTLRLMVVDKVGNYPDPCSIDLYLYPRHAAANSASNEN